MALIGDHLSTHEYEFPKFVDDDYTILEEFGSNERNHSNLVLVAQSSRCRFV